ncbi:hypothetical protein ACFHWD_14520 [Clostridium sp. MT-14]
MFRIWNGGTMNKYEKLIEDSRKKQSKLTLNQYKKIRDLYRDVAKSLETKANKAKKGSLTERWAKDYKKAVRTQIKQMNSVLKNIVSENIEKSAENATDIQLNFFEQINVENGLGMSESFKNMFSSVPNDVLKDIVSGDFYKDGKGLSQRLWFNGNKVNGDIDRIIQKGIAEKKSAYELAQDLQTYVNPNSKKDWDWKKVYPNVAKTIDYNAQRLARTSISHAYTLSMLKSCEKNPFVNKVKWHSVFAPGRTCPLCKERDGQEYLLKNCPMDHPNGLCYQEPLLDDSLENIGSRLNSWVKGGNDPALDSWYDKYGNYFSGESKIGIKSTANNGIKTIEDAKKVLINEVGFTEVEDSFMENVDPELIINNTRQLEKLENKYGVIHDSVNTTICSSSRGGNAIAYVANEATNPTRQNLSLCPDDYSNFNKLIKYEKTATEKGYFMPRALTNEELSISTVTHEYGHMLQNKLIEDEMRAKGWIPDKPMQFINTKRKTSKAVLKWYTDIEMKVKKRCYDEIIDIAKKNNPKFDFNSNISRYGRESYGEFFAEVFMNAELSKPNELGLAMRKWLKSFKDMRNKTIAKDKGAIRGALTGKNDPDNKLREKHAEQYYKSVRNRDKNLEIETISKNTGIDVKSIEKVYNHVFINKYDLYGGHRNFDADYDMSQSWQRLREGKSIQEHDIIMLKHERLEYELMNRYNKNYKEAHKLAESKYNYDKALIKYLKENNLD